MEIVRDKRDRRVLEISAVAKTYEGRPMKLQNWLSIINDELPDLYKIPNGVKLAFLFKRVPGVIRVGKDYCYQGMGCELATKELY